MPQTKHAEQTLVEKVEENRDTVRFDILTYLLANAGQDKTVSEFIQHKGYSNQPAVRRKIQRAFQDLFKQEKLVAKFGLQIKKDANTRLYSIDKNAELYKAFHKVKPETVLQLLKQRLSQAQRFELNANDHAWLNTLDSVLGKIYIAPDTLLLPAPEKEQVVTAVYQSLAQQHYLQLKYENSAGKKSELTFLPWGLMFKGLTTYVVGNKKGEREYRTLALYRIDSAEITSDEAGLFDGFSETLSFQQFCEEKGIAVFANPDDKLEEVKLRFYQSGGHLAQMKLANEQILVRYTGSKCHRPSAAADYFELEVTARVLIGRKFKEWLRSFGAEVEVIAPASLRQEMLEELKKTLANYQ